VRDVVILGGPNGAGKTTTAQILIPKAMGIREFVNADEIARGLSPFNAQGASVAAGRVMLRRIPELVGRGESFAFETTCAGLQHLRWLAAAKAAGWRLNLIYLWLATPELAIERVARRVRDGGHDIPPDVIRRRWRSGLGNMKRLFLPLVHNAFIYDNSGADPILIATRGPDEPLVIVDRDRWAMIERLCR
jgi:predicted ABC-type ATPase